MSATVHTPAVRATAPSTSRWLRLDALMSGSSGLLLAVGGPLVDGLLGAPAAFLVPLGLLLVGYAAALELLARGGAPAGGVKLVIAANALWVVASIVAVLADLLTLTAMGTVVAVVQAAAVALLTELQWRALTARR